MTSRRAVAAGEYMLPTVTLVVVAWVLSRPELRRAVPSQSLAAIALTAVALLGLFYGQRFR